MRPKDFNVFLVRSGWQLVYSFANICEVMIAEDLIESRHRLQVLEQIPHTFILALPPIVCLEFRSVVNAFSNNVEPERIESFVTQWHQTYRYPGRPNDEDLLVNYRLVDQVLHLLMRNARLFRNLRRRAFVLQEAVDEDRVIADAVRRNRARFEGGLRRQLMICGIELPNSFRDFARWIRNEPSRCPGWRIFHETYLEFCTNVNDRVDEGDIRDFSHISCLPYIDAITLDRRMAGYCRQASTRLSELNHTVDYLDRIFPNSEAWLATV